MIEIQTIGDVDRALQQLQDRVARDSKLCPVPGVLEPAEAMRISRLLQQIENDSISHLVARMTRRYDVELDQFAKEIDRLREAVRSCAETCTALEQRSRIEATNAPR